MVVSHHGKKKNFPLRIDPELYAVIERWAQEEFRSVNSHIEFLLRDAARREGRLKKKRRKNKTSIIFSASRKLAADFLQILAP